MNYKHKEPAMNFNQGYRFITFIFLLLFAGFFSCREQTADKADSKYYYFPETNVYYDQQAGLYSYSLDSGQNWISFPIPKNDQQLLVGNKIEISVTNNEAVWGNNQSDIKKYNGTLLAILSADTGMDKRQKAIIEKAIKTQESTDEGVNGSTETKKPNFFQRLFGKKKKKTNQ
ncbi:MAG: hypothetical protein ABIY51_06750 [Ferruginibacter sp.]